MENQFTTTFIPKKPLAAAANESAPISRPVGLLSSLSVVIFFITIIIGGGIYFWEKYEIANVATLNESVAKVEKGFEPALITQLQTLDKQLRNANTQVQNHVVITPIMDLLAASTLKQIQFNKFDVSYDDVKGVQVKMSGVSDGGYPAIAQQSDVLGGNTYLKNVLFSNFFLTQKGQISFDVSFGVIPSFVHFITAPMVNNSGATQ